jgi:hypothetical protein
MENQSQACRFQSAHLIYNIRKGAGRTSAFRDQILPACSTMNKRPDPSPAFEYPRPTSPAGLIHV